MQWKVSVFFKIKRKQFPSCVQYFLFPKNCILKYCKKYAEIYIKVLCS